MKLGSYRFAELLSKNLVNSRVVEKVPYDNENDILIIVPTSHHVFNKLHHSHFTRLKYKKFPKSIIIVIGFDIMIKINNIFNDMKVLSNYKIPIIYSPILESEVDVRFQLIKSDNYDNSLSFNNHDNDIHILNPDDFNVTLRSLFDSNDNYNIFCYYSNELEKNKFQEHIRYYNNIIQFYKRLISSDGKQLNNNDNKLVIT